MKKILFVCLGNICRSPLAEGIMKAKVKEAGLDVMVDSAGTSDYHIGEPPDARSIQTAKKHGIDISKQCGRQFSDDDFENFDLIFAMDYSNYNFILSKAKNDKQRSKVKLVLDVIFPGENMSVPDPYYGGEEGFNQVYQLLDNACNKIIAKYLTDNNE